MRLIFEGGFDIIYLVGVVLIGFVMLKTSDKNSTRRLFGVMAILLGLGDAFHLVPRILAIATNGFETLAPQLGIGKFITSITMTIFYLILYYVWRKRYKIYGNQKLTVTIWSLTIIRILLCLLPQNKWRSASQPMFYSILRNIPFAIMGIIIIIIFVQKVKEHQDKIFHNMPLAITLSFALYAPVVLFGDKYPIVGMLMIPKTLAYVWIVIMGYKLPKKDN